jgi:hypothetical protein
MYPATTAINSGLRHGLEESVPLAREDRYWDLEMLGARERDVMKDLTCFIERERRMTIPVRPMRDPFRSGRVRSDITSTVFALR